MNQNENQKNIKILFAIIGGLFVIGIIAITILFTVGKDKDEIKEISNPNEAMTGEIVKNNKGEKVFYDIEGNELKAQDFGIDNKDKKESLVTYKGEKFRGSPYYSIAEYKSMFWAHHNNILKYLEMNYPADKFTILSINQSKNISGVEMNILSERYDEFSMNLEIDLADTTRYYIMYDGYKEFLDLPNNIIINSEGEAVEIKD